MIVELALIPFWLLINLIITLIPDLTLSNMTITTDLLNILSSGVSVIGADKFVLIIGNVIFWYTVQFGWVTIEWVYKKIPGVE